MRYQDEAMQSVLAKGREVRLGKRSTVLHFWQIQMGMDQYLWIPFLGGWRSINPSYFDVNYRGTIGFDTLPNLFSFWNCSLKVWKWNWWALWYLRTSHFCTPSFSIMEHSQVSSWVSSSLHLLQQDRIQNRIQKAWASNRLNTSSVEGMNEWYIYIYIYIYIHVAYFVCHQSLLTVKGI